MIRWLVEAITAYLAADPALLDAIERIESNGNPAAISRTGDYGAMQVHAATSPVPRPLLLVHSVNRVEGARILRRWQRRAGGDTQRALQAYNCGGRGLAGECGTAYARRVLRVVQGGKR